MKKIVIILACVVLASCKQPDTTIVQESPDPVAPVQDTSKPVYVLNTTWKIVKSESLAREIESTDALVEEVAAHNSSTINDKWYLYVGSYPDIKDSPLCDIYIVNKVTNDPIRMDNGQGGTYELVWHDYPRQQMVDNLEGWKHDAQVYNANLYIDVVPPPPAIIIPTEEQIYAKYTINVIGKSGALIHTEHCSTVDLTDWHCTLDEYFAKRVNAWQNDLRNESNEDGPWHIVTGKLYEVGD